MPELELASGTSIHYRDDCYMKPWIRPEITCLVHGGAESGLVWYAWMPSMSSSFRVIRPDLPGHGGSTKPRGPYDWKPATLARDMLEVLDRLEIPTVHLIGSKFGGEVALVMAAANPDRVSTLTVLHPKFGGVPSFVSSVTQADLKAWARGSNRHRLGTQLPDEQVDWYNNLMLSCDESVIRALIGAAGDVDSRNLLAEIKVATLVVTMDRNGIAPLSAIAEWTSLLPIGELLVLPGDGYHPAFISPDECVRAVSSFIARHRTIA